MTSIRGGRLLGLGALVAAGMLAGTVAQASTLALIEGSSIDAVHSALAQAGVRPLVELERKAVIVELGSGQRAALEAAGLSVLAATDAVGSQTVTNARERIFLKAVAPGDDSLADGPLCGTKSNDEQLAEYRQDIQGLPNQADLEARLDQFLLQNPITTSADGNPADHWKQMRGKVGVGLFFLDSTQTGDNDEDWVQSDVDAMMASVARSALGWTRVAPPELNLSYSIVSSPPAANPISVEPSHNAPEKQWIHEALAHAGYDAHLGAYGYQYDIQTWSDYARDQIFHSDVAFPVFAITDHKHPTQWGKPGWPHVNPIFSYMVLNSTYGAKIVFAHEVGHIFYADDEYAANQFYCLCMAQPVGALRATTAGESLGHSNANCENCNANSIPCIMFSNQWLGGAIQGPDACWHSRAQIGWYETGMLHVTVDAPSTLPADGVDILLDGQPIGSTAARRYLKPGDYQLDVKADGYTVSPAVPISVHVDNRSELRYDFALSGSSTGSAAIR